MPVFEGRAQLLASVASAVDARHGEAVRLSFMKDGVLDPDRNAVVIRAVLQTDLKEDVRPPAGMRTAVAASRSQLHIDRAAYIGPMPVVGDSVRAMDRIGTPVYEVAWVDSRNAVRLILELNEK